MKFRSITLVGGLLLCALSAAATALVSTPESWQLRKEESAASMTRSGDKIEVKFPACKSWPAVFLTGDGLAVKQFRGYQYLLFEADNKRDVPTALSIEFRLSAPDKTEFARSRIILRPGLHTYKVLLSGEHQQFPVASVYFYVSQPDYNSHFTLENLRVAQRKPAKPLPPETVGDRAQLVLEAFDTPASMDRWFLRVQNSGATAKVQDRHKINGKPALEVKFPVCKVWPALHTVGDNLKAAENFYNYEYLSADIINLNPFRDGVTLELRVRDREGKPSMWKHFFHLQPGLNRCRLEMTYDLQAAQLDEIYIFTAKPSRDKHFVIGNLRLESDPLPKKQEQLRTMIAALSLDKPDTALQKEIDAARNMTPSSDFKVLFKQLDAVRALAERVDVANQKAAPELFRSVAKNAMGWGWANGSDRVYRDQQRFPGSIGGEGALTLARGETEGIQLCLYPLKNMDRVSVSISDLKSAAGDLLPASDIEVAPVGFVDMKKMRYYADRIGWTPDPICDYLKEFKVEQDKIQPVWIDVKATAEARPGIYRGTVAVKNGDDQLLQLPVQVQVHRFVLPYKNSLPVVTAARFDQGFYDYMYGDEKPETVKQFRGYLDGSVAYDELNDVAKHQVEVMHRFEKMISAHRIPNDHMYRPAPIKVEDLKRYLADRNRLVCLFAVEKDNKPEQLVEWMDRLAPVIIENNWQKNVYVYGFDEINPDLFQKAIETFRPLKKKYPWLKIMTTAFDYTLGRKTGMDEVIDIWVPQIREFFNNADENARARKDGKEVWYYVCCYPSPPIANWLLESKPTATRIMLGMMPYKYDIEGFLQWAIIRWKANRTFEENGKLVTKELIWDKKLTDGPLTSHDGKGFYEFNGDGFLFYPGENGPVTTVRARLVRDGIEDFEYFTLLEQRIADVKAGKISAPTGWLKRAESELKIEDKLVSAPHLYTHDGRELIAKREKIAALLDEVTK